MDHPFQPSALPNKFKMIKEYFQEVFLAFQPNYRPPAQFNGYTYYPSAKGGFTDCPLRAEMTRPDSINDIDIEPFSMIGKQMEI